MVLLLLLLLLLLGARKRRRGRGNAPLVVAATDDAISLDWCRPCFFVVVCLRNTNETRCPSVFLFSSSPLFRVMLAKGNGG